MKNKNNLENSALKEAGLEQISGGATSFDSKTNKFSTICDVCGEKIKNVAEDAYIMRTGNNLTHHICKSCGEKKLKSLFKNK